MFKVGGKAYFIESLLDYPIPCKIVSITDYDQAAKNHLYIVAVENNGNKIEGYSAQFSVKKTVPYNQYLAPINTYSQWMKNNNIYI